MQDNWLDSLEQLIDDRLEPTREEALLALARSCDQTSPPPSLRGHLFRSIERLESLPERDALLANAAKLLDRDVDAVTRHFDRFDDDSYWGRSAPGVGLTMIRAGSGHARSTVAAFVRLAPGSDFPPHWHNGEETTLILQGGLRNDDDHDYWAGDTMRCGAGGPHTLRGIGFEPCIALVIAESGVSFAPPPRET